MTIIQGSGLVIDYTVDGSESISVCFLHGWSGFLAPGPAGRGTSSSLLPPRSLSTSFGYSFVFRLCPSPTALVPTLHSSLTRLINIGIFIFVQGLTLGQFLTNAQVFISGTKDLLVFLDSGYIPQHRSAQKKK